MNHPILLPHIKPKEISKKTIDNLILELVRIKFYYIKSYKSMC